MDFGVFNGAEEELEAFLGREESQPAPVPTNEPPAPTEMELALKALAELKKHTSAVVLAEGDLIELH